MINIKSVLDGFPVVLGSMPVQFGMLMTLLLSIKIPRNMDDQEKFNADATFMYCLLVINHALILIIKVVQSRIAFQYGNLCRFLMMACLFLQLFTINFLLGDYIFDQTDSEILTARRGVGWKENITWHKFNVWLHLEMYMFVGTIVSGVCFMFIRSFVKN